MIIIYLFIGVFATILSALPLGASNIAVINTTLRENVKQAFKIAITAGVAEVLLSYYALDCNEVIKGFFDTHLWVQTAVAVLLFVVGGYLFFKKQSVSKSNQKKRNRSKYTTGFILGIINPPVLIYWVIAFGVLNNNNFMLSLQSSFSVLFLFFSGVYLGKLLTLYAYSRMSVIIKNKVNNITQILNRVTGLLLMIIGLIQSTQLYFL